MAVDVKIPQMGESVSEAILLEWLKEDGEYVARDEPICVLETDKANVDLPAPAAGILRPLKALDETLEMGDIIARIEEGEEADGVEATESEGDEKAEELPQIEEEESVSEAAVDEAAVAENAIADELSPAVRRLIEEQDLDAADIKGTGRGGRLTKEDVLAYLEEKGKAAEQAKVPKAEAPKTEGKAEPPKAEAPKVKAETSKAKASQVKAEAPKPKAPKPKAPQQPQKAEEGFDEEGIRRVPMSRIRQRIAEHLVAAQQNAAMLTTFNEVDMSGVMTLRAKYKERFAEVHGISLGLMSFFSRAVVLALQEFPPVNASIDGTDIVYHGYVNLGIAVSTDRGLVVPVLRHAEKMSMARIEGEIKRLARGVRDNKLSMDDLSSGTFTITNGGVFGSLLSTPILNAPQSGILGMHAIQQRPVAIDGKVEIRPMMYVALSYDHRLVDGQQSVSFLVRVKQLVEDPARLMLEI